VGGGGGVRGIAVVCALSWSCKCGTQKHSVEEVAGRGRLLIARVIPRPLSSPVGDRPIELVVQQIKEHSSFHAAAGMRAGGSVWCFQWRTAAPYWGLSVPFLFPLLLFVFPTALLWRRDHILTKRARAGRCPKCGYDLAGLNSGAFPECGKAAPPLPTT
jgi:hypothetical protein